jgi:GNAT superfamily N-acetyltransferase
MLWPVSDVIRAERALFCRAESAGVAASAAGVGGRFRTWRQGGLLAVSATEPRLAFLSTISGVTRGNMASVGGVLRSPAWDGVRPTVVAPAELALGLVAAGERALATRRLDEPPAAASGVTDADDTFLDVLLAGYQVTGLIADYIRAEHGMSTVHRFFAVEDGTPIAAAAMTIHDDVAVLGGASTLPDHRGRGAQTRLLAHRLRLATEAGCTLAAATARPGSVSAANLERAGFTVHRRLAWTTAG